MMKLMMIATLVLFSLSMGNMDAGEGRQRQQRAVGDLKLALLFLAEQQQDIVNMHNLLRKTVNPTASNMRQMYWDDELAKLASNYTKKCSFDHSTGLGNAEFSSVGENIAKTGLVNPNTTVQAWFNEESDFTFSTGECAAGKKCGHYTQVVWATSYKIGCGYALCNNLMPSGQGYIIVCNYGPAGNKLREGSQTIVEDPYKNGTSCSKCQAGLICLDQLCALPPAAGGNGGEVSTMTTRATSTTQDKHSTTSTTSKALSFHRNGGIAMIFVQFLGLAIAAIGILA